MNIAEFFVHIRVFFFSCGVDTEASTYITDLFGHRIHCMCILNLNNCSFFTGLGEAQRKFGNMF